MICQMIGIFLYCGQAAQPLAMFPQSNNLPTAEMTQQLSQSRQYRRDAATTTLDQCEVGMRIMDAQCLYDMKYSAASRQACFKGCAR